MDKLTPIQVDCVDIRILDQLVQEARIKGIKEAYPLTDDEAVIIPNQIMINALIPQMKLLMGSIERLDKEIKKRQHALSDHKIFDSFPGAGPQLSPRLLVAFGTIRERYQHLSEIQQFVGIAPVIERSGQKSWTHWRYSCPKFLRQTFVEWAGQSVRFSFGQKPITNNKKVSENLIIRSFAHWYLSG